MTIPLMSSVDTSVSLSFLAYLNQMAPIARFIDKFVPLLHALQEYMSGGRDYIVWALWSKTLKLQNEPALILGLWKAASSEGYW